MESEFEKHACEYKNEAECEEEIDSETDFEKEEVDFYESDK